MRRPSVFVAVLFGLVAAGPWHGVAQESPGTPDVSPAATGADVPMYRANPARSGEMPGPGPEGQPVERWRVQAAGSATRSPAVAGGVVYAGSGDGTLSALDAATGAERWRFRADGDERDQNGEGPNEDGGRDATHGDSLPVRPCQGRVLRATNANESAVRSNAPPGRPGPTAVRKAGRGRHGFADTP